MGERRHTTCTQRHDCLHRHVQTRISANRAWLESQGNFLLKRLFRKVAVLRMFLGPVQTIFGGANRPYSYPSNTESAS